MSEFEEDEVTREYRRLGAGAAGGPSPAVRERILAFASDLSAQRARGRIVPLRRPRVFPWRSALFGTVAAAALTGLTLAPLLLQRLREPAKSALVDVHEPVQVELSEDQAASPTLIEIEPPPPAAAPPARGAALRRAPAPPSESRVARSAPAAPPAAVAPAANAVTAQVREAAADQVQRSGGIPRAEAARPALTARAASAPPASTPLQTLAVQGATEQLQGLLEEGREVDARDALGRTPLLAAVEGGQLESARLLLEHGANPNLADARGRTPLAAAQRSGRADIVALLRRHGAR